MATTLVWDAMNSTLPETTIPHSTEITTGISTSSQTPDGSTATTFLYDNGTTHTYDTYDLFIHPHWKLFPTISDSWHDFIAVYITIVGITGVLGNSLVIWMFVTTKSLRTPPNMFVVNLAISDLTFSAVNGFPLLTLSAVNRKWLFGNLGCQLYALGGSIFGLLSINTMSLIAYDRYQVITKPFETMKKISHRRAFIQLVIIWAWALTWSLPPLFGWGAFIPEGFQTSCTFDYLTRTTNNRSFMLCLYLLGFCVPVAVVFVCYFYIVRTIMGHTKEMKSIEENIGGKSVQSVNEQKKADIQVAKVSLAVVTLYMISWMPYATVALIGQFGDVTLVTPYVSELPVMFAKASAMHNPIVYALSHPRFRKEIYLRFPWMMCFKPEPSKLQDQSTMRRKMGNSSVSSTMTYIGSVPTTPAENFPPADRRDSSMEKEIINNLLGVIAEMSKNHARADVNELSEIKSSIRKYLKEDPDAGQLNVYTVPEVPMPNNTPALERSGVNPSDQKEGVPSEKQTEITEKINKNTDQTVM